MLVASRLRESVVRFDSYILDPRCCLYPIRVITDWREHYQVLA